MQIAPIPHDGAGLSFELEERHRENGVAAKCYLSYLAAGVFVIVTLQGCVLTFDLPQTVVALFCVLLFIVEYLIFGDRDDVPRLKSSTPLSLFIGISILAITFIMMFS